MKWSYSGNTQTFTSPINKFTQTVGLSGLLWSASLNWAILEEDDYNILNPFMLQLRGQAGRFYLSPAQYEGDHSTGLTATTADSISVELSSPVSTLNIGNYLSINNELKMIVEKISDTTYKVEPPFRELYIAQPVELNKPTAIMRLLTDTYDMDFRPPIVQNVSFDIIESLA